jgi:ribosome-associated heat shock protein Hsp15
MEAAGAAQAPAALDGLRVADSSALSTRADRWLWAARAFKSRTLAADACDGGKVTVNGVGAKPHKLIRPGDELVLTTGNGKRILKVVGLAERRGPASVARTLYEDLSPPPPPRDPTMPRRDPGSGRPSKRERRQLSRRW